MEEGSALHHDEDDEDDSSSDDMLDEIPDGKLAFSKEKDVMGTTIRVAFVFVHNLNDNLEFASKSIVVVF